MGIDPTPEEGEYSYGKGTVYVISKDPKEFVLDGANDDELINRLRYLFQEKTNGGTLEFKNTFYLERGSYDYD